jgi:hypothetical protein
MRPNQSSKLRINTNVENGYYNNNSIRTNQYSTKELKNNRIGLSPGKNFTTLLNNYDNKKEERKTGIIRSNSRSDHSRSEYNLIPNSTKAANISKTIPTKAQPLSTRNNKDNKEYSTESNDTINIMSVFGQNNTPISLKNLSLPVPGYEKSKHSVKQMHIIRAYAANTHQGIIRTYNEDRVSIILNIIKPVSFQGDYWPKCSFFGIYDGHGGSGCADFLRDNLHQYVLFINLDN